MTGCRIHLFRLWTPVFAWALVILCLSSIPGKNIPRVNIPQIDKLVHFSEYLILGLLTARALLGTVANISLAKTVILSIIIISLYAAFDEWHQNFIPDRTCDIFDFSADFIGLSTGAILYGIKKCRQ